MLPVTTYSSYWTVEFQAALNDDLWLYAANDKKSRELTEDEDEARQVREHLDKIGLPYRVRLYTREERVQLVEDKS